MRINPLSYKEMKILEKERTKNRKICKCGHSLLIGLQDKQVYSHCGILVFKNKKAEDEYRIKEQIIKQRRESKK